MARATSFQTGVSVASCSAGRFIVVSLRKSQGLLACEETIGRRGPPIYVIYFENEYRQSVSDYVTGPGLNSARELKIPHLSDQVFLRPEATSRMR